jgi:hypothetical protein
MRNNIDSSLNGNGAQTLVNESVRLDTSKEIPALNIRFYALSLPLFLSVLQSGM